MSLRQTINYDTAGNFTFDASKIEIVGSRAQLKLNPLTGQIFSQNFSSSSGFGFDSNATEFVGGVMRQKDTRPAGSLFFAQLKSNGNANWNTGGSITGTPTSQVTYGSKGANFSAAAAQYLDFNATSNITAQIGTIRFLFTPLFTGGPGDYQFLMVSSAANNNLSGLLDVWLESSGALHFRGINSAGTQIFDVNSLVSWVANQTYEIEIDYDFDNGASHLFLDGVQIGSTQAFTYSRGTIGLFRFGTAYVPQGGVANFSISDVVTFSTVQHTGNYSAPSALQNLTIYIADWIVVPTLTYPGIGNLFSFDSAAITDSNSPRYILNGRYWNGSMWTSSNLTYAQASSAAQILANISTLPVSNTLVVQVSFQAGSSAMSVDALTVNYTGQIYPVSNPSIINNGSFLTDELVDFNQDVSASGSDAIKFILQIQNVDTYWNGSAWVTSDGTYAQSNLASQIVAHLATLDLSVGRTVKLKALLHSNDGSTTPSIGSSELDYDFFISSPAEPSRCIAYAFLGDMIGKETPVQSAILIVNLTRAFAYGNRIIGPGIRKFAFNSNGYCETTAAYLQTTDATASEDGLVETATPVIAPYTFTIQYKDSTGVEQNLTTTAISIPNQVSVNLNTLMSFS